MKTNTHGPKVNAFTFVELLALIAVLAMLTIILLPAMAQDAKESHRKMCVNNLRQLELAFKTWAVDNGDKLPMQVSTKLGGTKELASTGNTFRHFQVMSNEINAPKILICPDDTRSVTANFGDLQNKNVSYFVGLDASDPYPQRLLIGDRNIENGNAPVHSVLELRPEVPAHWTEALHVNEGNIGVADGSVRQVSNAGLQQVLKATRNPLNRIALPE